MTDAITIRRTVQPGDVKKSIEDALKRNANIEATGIRVAVVDGRVTLDGNVRAWYERELAEDAAWAAPGVRAVEDHIQVSGVSSSENWA